MTTMMTTTYTISRDGESVAKATRRLKNKNERISFQDCESLKSKCSDQANTNTYNMLSNITTRLKGFRP